jgi:putative acetyltransferase
VSNFNITIRQTNTKDRDEILEVERLAFGSEEEAQLVDDLLKDPTSEPLISLLAFHDDKPIGHILFTRCKISGHSEDILAHILAPLAVIPELQNQGVGSALVKDGLGMLRKMDSKLVFVLGHKSYYPRFGFKPFAERQDFPPPFPIPPKDADAWMVHYLGDEQIQGGQVMVARAMDDEKYWQE